MFFLGIKISASYFYPRPPGGGRPSASKLIVEKSINFYPRPPGGGRRLRRLPALNPVKGFLSTPSGWRATLERVGCIGLREISIHALRVEGDQARLN